MRERYTKSSQAPLLLDAAIKLKVNGVTSASNEAAKVAAITTLQDDMGSSQLTETNIIFEKLGNKVLLQSVFKRLQFTDPITAEFFKEGTTISAAKEIIDTKLLTAHKYDKSVRYPTSQVQAGTLQTMLHTITKEYVTNTVFLTGAKAAFASNAAYGEFMAKQTSILAESLQVILFEKLTPLMLGDVKNTITLPTAVKDWAEIFTNVNSISEDMARIPTAKYNMGYSDPATAVAGADGNNRKQVVARKNQILIMSIATRNLIEAKVGAVKFHNQYFKNTPYKKVLFVESDANFMYLIADNAFEGYFRANKMTTQQWAANMSIEYFLHYWLVFGSIPWANGVKIGFTLPTDSYLALPKTDGTIPTAPTTRSANEDDNIDATLPDSEDK